MRLDEYLETANHLIADIIRHVVATLPFKPNYLLWFSQGLDREKVKQGLAMMKDQAVITQMLEWCAIELKGRYKYDTFINYMFFELQEDAMHWKLRWA